MSGRKLGVSSIKILVFDETDHMLAEDGSFKDDSLKIKKEIERISSHCQVNLVVNYDLPPEPDYRIGRAGRFGRKGEFHTSGQTSSSQYLASLALSKI